MLDVVLNTIKIRVLSTIDYSIDNTCICCYNRFWYKQALSAVPLVVLGMDTAAACGGVGVGIN